MSGNTKHSPLVPDNPFQKYQSQMAGKIQTWPNFCFTEHEMKAWVPTHNNIQYAIWQREKCPTTGKLHLQGYVQLVKARDMAWIKRNLFPTAHLELARGGYEANKEYCSKDDTRDEGDAGPWEHGTPKAQGARTDLGQIIQMAKEQKPVTEMLETVSSSLRYLNNAIKARALFQKDRTEKPYVTYIWGPAGVGKSHYVFEKHGYHNVYVKDDSQWWDGYDQQTVVLMDDCDLQNKWEMSTLLRLWDKWPYTVQVKGSTVKFNSPYIYITSNNPIPAFILAHTSLHRRIDKIYKYDNIPRRQGVKRGLAVEERLVVKEEDDMDVVVLDNNVIVID